MARAVGPFPTTIGSIADFGWLLHATSRFGTVHLPQKLATWRFHGSQLSIYRNRARGASGQSMCQQILPEIRQRHPHLLTRNDCAAFLLPFKRDSRDRRLDEFTTGSRQQSDCYG